MVTEMSILTWICDKKSTRLGSLKCIFHERQVKLKISNVRDYAMHQRIVNKHWTLNRKKKVVSEWINWNWKLENKKRNKNISFEIQSRKILKYN